MSFSITLLDAFFYPYNIFSTTISFCNFPISFLYFGFVCFVAELQYHFYFLLLLVLHNICEFILRRSMENGTSSTTRKWNFKENEKLASASGLTVRSVLHKLRSCVDPADTRPVIPLGHGDPSAFPCFRTTPIAEDAISHAVRSAKFNGYSSTVGILPARRYLKILLEQC